MEDPTRPRLSKLVFYVGDLLLLVLAAYICWQGHRPLLIWEAWALVSCVVLGGALAAIPEIIEYHAAQRLAESNRLAEALHRLQNIEQVSRQISSATAAWQAVQDDAGKAMTAAREITERITTEARAFQEFLQKTHDSERNHLRLEAEKLRRAEGDWVHVLVRIMDHVYALYQAAVRAGSASIIEQIGSFQQACRDTSRRVGLVPVVAQPGDTFDPELHQPEREDPKPTPQSRTAETLATGYRYQGILIRKALVTLQGDRPEPPALPIREIQQRQANPELPAPATPTEHTRPAPAETASLAEDTAASPAPRPPHPTSDELPTEMIPASGVRRPPAEAPILPSPTAGPVPSEAPVDASQDDSSAPPAAPEPESTALPSAEAVPTGPIPDATPETPASPPSPPEKVPPRPLQETLEL